MGFVCMGDNVSFVMLDVLFSSFTGCPQGLVWIMGHSYVCWGARRVDVRPAGRQLGISRREACIKWLGVPEMLWSRIMPEVHRFVRLDRHTDILVLHVGGNDLGLRSKLDITQDIKFDVLRLRFAFPRMVIVWSDVNARTTWRLARSVERVNKARKKVNREVSRFVVKNGGASCQASVVGGRYLALPFEMMVYTSMTWG